MAEICRFLKIMTKDILYRILFIFNMLDIFSSEESNRHQPVVTGMIFRFFQEKRSQFSDFPKESESLSIDDIHIKA